MSLFEEKYTIVGWHNEKHFMTAKRLLERVQEDIKSDYNWIASATELVRVCTQPSFPQEYARAIEIAILNCYASLETKRELGGHSEDTDSEAVAFCYRSLFGISEEANEARQKYLRAIIEGVTKYHFRLLEFNHHGPTYSKIRDEWKNAMLEKYGSEVHFNFDQLRQELHDDFDKVMKKAEEEGAFEEDDRASREADKKFWARILPELL